MQRIAALGPSNTFSELAAREYTRQLGTDCGIALFPTLGKAFAAVGNGCDCAVLPIENLAEGHVPIVLDLLINSRMVISHELLLPIQFSLVANCDALAGITRVYSQFVTQGQCEAFLDRLHDVPIITTGSNGTSLEEVRMGRPGEAAIVPAFSVRQGDFPLVIESVADRRNNQTRFITVAPVAASTDRTLPHKTSLLIVESVDRPGVLAAILGAFARRQINLVSIMSRPTKEMMGQYHFFIDVEGHAEAPGIVEAVAEIRQENTVRLLGSYPRALSVS
jgi:prephenate dehydratase